jgi:hypothetical protein
VINADISKTLLDEMEAKYPHRCPDLNILDRMIWFKAGQRSVVDEMAVSFTHQQKSKPGSHVYDKRT